MTAIERMTRYGSSYRVVLDCGHYLRRTKAECKLQQLYIGKRIGCPACAEQEARRRGEIISPDGLTKSAGLGKLKE